MRSRLTTKVSLPRPRLSSTTRGRLHIDTIDEAPALESSRVGLLAAMRFHSDGRALVYDGLPGPAPMRARPASLR